MQAKDTRSGLHVRVVSPTPECSVNRLPRPRRWYTPAIAILLFLLGGNSLAWYIHSHLVVLPNHTFQALFPDDIGPGKRVLYLGDSQAELIRDAAPGAKNAEEWLDADLRREPAAHPLHVQPATQRGLTMNGMLIGTVAAGEQSPPTTDVIVIPLRLDEFRTTTASEDVRKLAQVPRVRKVLDELLWGAPQLNDARTSLNTIENEFDSGSTQHGSPAEVVEAKLQSVADLMPLFAWRAELQRALVISLRRVRNTAGGLTSETPRAVPPVPYRTNLQFLELTLRYAKRRGVCPIVFLAPVRADGRNPDLPQDLARMRADAMALASRYDVDLFDYSGLLADERYWSVYPRTLEGLEGQRDYAHLRESGHRVLGERLHDDLKATLGRRSEPQP